MSSEKTKQFGSLTKKNQMCPLCISRGFLSGGWAFKQKKKCWIKRSTLSTSNFLPFFKARTSKDKSFANGSNKNDPKTRSRSPEIGIFKRSTRRSEVPDRVEQRIAADPTNPRRNQGRSWVFLGKTSRGSERRAKPGRVKDEEKSGRSSLGFVLWALGKVGMS